MAAIVAAIGLTLLVGIAGQLSLGHAFFVAIGAYGYAYLAGEDVPGVDAPAGLGLPPLLALLGAVALAGLAGALFSPISGRVRGIYLGLASLGPGLHRPAHPAERHRDHRRLRRASRSSRSASSASASRTPTPTTCRSSACRYGPLERLWYLGLVLVAVADLVRPQPRPQPARAGARAPCATARSPPR